MRIKIKKVFSLLFKKRKFLSVLTLIISVFLFIPRMVFAAWYDFLIGAITFIPSFLISLIIYIGVVLSALLAKFASLMLQWVTGPNFTSLSYTNPAENEIIRIGLGITKGFVNMILVLVLIYIAIATILRLAGYETKKLLVTFIIVALLVNFSPVLCGLIVDASNIVMNFFLKEITGGVSLVSSLGAIKDTLLGAFGEWTKFKASEQVESIFLLSMMVIVNLGLTLGFLIFSFLFIARYIVIWILVILSPLAFASYILPVTRKFWDLWWKQLLQWSFIGVIAGFFLYLTEQFASLGPGVFGTATGLGSSFLPYIVPIAFLFIGLIFGLQTSAMGASAIINVTKRGTKRAGVWTSKRAWQKGIRPNIDRFLYKGTKKLLGKGAGTREIAGGISSAVEKVPVVRWFLPETFRKYGQVRPAISEAEKRAESYSSQTLGHRIFAKADIETDAVGGLMAMLKRGDGQDIFNEAKKFGKWKGMSDDQLLADKGFQNTLGRLLDLTQKGGLHSQTIRSDPRLAIIAARTGLPGYGDIKDAAGNPLKGESLERAAVRKAVGETRAQHIANWEPEVLQNKHVIEAALGQFDRERWLQINRQIKRGQEFALRGIDSAFSDFTTARNLDVSPGKVKKAWEEYLKHIKEQNQGLEGYAKALKDKRTRDTGWREGNTLPKEQRWSRPPAAAPTAAAGMGIAEEKEPPPSPPPKGRSVKGKPGWVKSGGGIIYPEDIGKKEPKGRQP